MTKSLCGTCKTAGRRQDRLRGRRGLVRQVLPGARPPAVAACRRRSSGTSTRCRSSRPTRRRGGSASRSTDGLSVRLRRLPVASAEGLPAGRAHHLGVQPRLSDLLHDQQERRRAPHVGGRPARRSSTICAEDHDELDIINFTGGEPTLHPQLPEFLEMCRDGGHPPADDLHQRPEAARRGLRAQAGRARRAHRALARHVPTRRPTSVLLGANTVKAKLKVLDLLEKHDVATTILPAVAAGLNDDEVGRAARARARAGRTSARSSCTRSTFTGQGGVGFQRSARITIPDLHRPHRGGHRRPHRLARLRAVAAGAPALLLDLLPAAASTAAATSRSRASRRGRSCSSCWRTRSTSSRARSWRRSSATSIDDLWANPDRVARERRRAARRSSGCSSEMFPAEPAASRILERQKIAERVGEGDLHPLAHGRGELRRRPGHEVLRRRAARRTAANIPTCSYNVLYREKDARFADPKMLAAHDAPGPPRRAPPSGKEATA